MGALTGCRLPRPRPDRSTGSLHPPLMTQHRIVVLGGGRVGSAIAVDLAGSGLSVTVADRDPAILQRVAGMADVRTKQADLLDEATVHELASEADLVVGAVPGWMGFRTVERVLRAGRDIVDISFFEEDPFRLDGLAKEQGVRAVVDCGVAPGLSNLLLGYGETAFDQLETFVCYVGGLPQDPVEPWCYKAPYSPPDVIEMYTRPARLRRAGENLTVPALSEPELLTFDGVGTLEAFNTDGLRTPLDTSAVPNMVEKTLRYPGHRERVELLTTSGFFDAQERTVGDTRVRPLDLSAALLADQWFKTEADLDVTVMRIVLEGTREGSHERWSYDLCDRHHGRDGISSMARTTGYPCASVARRILAGGYETPGIAPPEFLGRDVAFFEAILADLEQRDVTFRVKKERV